MRFLFPVGVTYSFACSRCEAKEEENVMQWAMQETLIPTLPIGWQLVGAGMLGGGVGLVCPKHHVKVEDKD